MQKNILQTDHLLTEEVLLISLPHLNQGDEYDFIFEKQLLVQDLALLQHLFV